MTLIVLSHIYLLLSLLPGSCIVLHLARLYLIVWFLNNCRKWQFCGIFIKNSTVILKISFPASGDCCQKIVLELIELNVPCTTLVQQKNN